MNFNSRRLIELRSQERTVSGILDLIEKSSKFGEFLEFNIKNSSFSKSRHLSDLIAAFFLGYQKKFLEVGAYHPINGSDTYMLEKKFMWSGIQIEPNPRMAKKLREYRSAEVINLALVSKLSSKKRLDMDSGKMSRLIGQKVGAINIDNFIKLKGTNFDALFMDIEGGELKLLNNDKFSCFKFRFLSIERIWNFKKIEIALKNLGYVNFWPVISGYESWWLKSPQELGLEQGIDFS